MRFSLKLAAANRQDLQLQDAASPGKPQEKWSMTYKPGRLRTGKIKIFSFNPAKSVLNQKES